MMKPLVIGAVAYDSRVVAIWEGMREYFREARVPIDYVLFSNYDRQVQALLARHIDIAWNTNLAWVKLHQRTGGTCRALAMRDVDAGFTTVIVARADSGIESLAELRGKRLALGSADSAQAAILPLHYLLEADIEATKDCTLLRFDIDVGKHGDTGTSELEVLRAVRGERMPGQWQRVPGFVRWPKGGSMPGKSGRSGPRQVILTAISQCWAISPKTWVATGPKRCWACSTTTALARVNGSRRAETLETHRPCLPGRLPGTAHCGRAARPVPHLAAVMRHA